jgi:hypothetical protein
MPSNPDNGTAIATNSKGRRRFVVAAAIVVGAALVAAIAWHVSAVGSYRRSFELAVSLGDRTAAAKLAARLEPWDTRFATRATVMTKWQHGSVLLSQGAYLPAMLELADAYRLDVGDKELLALFQKAQRELSVSSNFKAHIQHGHEGPGGTLRPQDLLP